MYKLYSLGLKNFCLQIIFLFFVVYCILKVTWKPEKDTEARLSIVRIVKRHRFESKASTSKHGCCCNIHDVLRKTNTLGTCIQRVVIREQGTKSIAMKCIARSIYVESLCAVAAAFWKCLREVSNAWACLKKPFFESAPRI